MSEGNNIKRFGIWIALAATLAATLWTAFESEADSEGLEPAVRPHRLLATRPVKTPGRAEPQELDISILTSRQVSAEAPVNLFAPPGVAAGPEPVLAQPEHEAVPDIPYTYAGKLEEEDGRYTVFLREDSMNYVVKQGDVIGQWQVRSIRPPHMVLRYQPLKADVTMIIGEAS